MSKYRCRFRRLQDGVERAALKTAEERVLEGGPEREGARMTGPLHSELVENAMHGGLRTNNEVAQLAAQLVRLGEGCIIAGSGASSRKRFAAGTD